MTDRFRLVSLASAATLALALAQPVAAEGEQAPAAPAPVAAAPAEAAAPAPVAAAPAEAAAPAPAAAAPVEVAAPAPAAAPPAEVAAPADRRAAAVARMEQHMADMNTERNKRYAELRQRANEVGLELPETPPWDQKGMPEMPAMPEMPPMPAEMGAPTKALTAAERDAARAAHYQAMRERAKARGVDLPETPPHKLMTDEERQARMDKMRNMTPEERMAARAETYKQLRERAAAQGIELPETPPWEQAQQRRKAMQEKWDAYRKQVEAMTDEQREAAQAVFGAAPEARPMHHQMPNQMPMQMPMQRPQMPMGMPQDMRMDMPAEMPVPGQGPRGFAPCPQGDCGAGMMPPRGMMPGWGGNQGQEPMPAQGGYGAPWGRGW